LDSGEAQGELGAGVRSRVSLSALAELLGVADPGAEMHALVARLYPICRSITGDGVRETLRLMHEVAPLEVHEVPSGTQVFDWTVPPEWNVRDAYVANSKGERVVDFKRNNLHLVGYSVPVACKLGLAELAPRLHSLPDRPDWIPYRSSFYREDWGFCLTQRARDALPEGEYEVRIDATLAPGSLTYGELFVAGTSDDEILLSAHVCHPSLCNDNLSGIAVALMLARYVSALAASGRRRRYGYRFVFAPATIGAITWLARNEHKLARIRHGLVLTLLGDAGKTTYKRSRRGDARIDRAVAHVLAHVGAPHQLLDFIPYGYDERQYCSPGIDLPVGCLMRTPYAQFPEYHTSGDDLSFVKPASLADSLDKTLQVLELLEADEIYLNLKPKCEPQLGKRGIYRALSERLTEGGGDRASQELAMLWVLNQSDGHHSLLDIAERSGIAFPAIATAARVLREHDLIARAPKNPPPPST
jgi:aminopeptidase-like protein